jgi:hypothetical protein
MLTDASQSMPAVPPQKGVSKVTRFVVALFFFGPQLLFTSVLDKGLLDSLAASFRTTQFALQVYATAWFFIGLLCLTKIDSLSSAAPSANFRYRVAKLVDCLRVQLIAMFAIFGFWAVTVYVLVGAIGLITKPLLVVALLGWGALGAILLSLPVAFRHQWKTYPEDRPKWPFRRADNTPVSHDN